MIDKLVYVFVKPQFVDAENAQNYHIFKGYYDLRTGHFISFTNGKSCCGKCHCKSSSERVRPFENPNEDSLMAARRYAAYLEEHGKKVCGQCVATLFSDGI